MMMGMGIGALRLTSGAIAAFAIGLGLAISPANAWDRAACSKHYAADGWEAVVYTSAAYQWAFRTNGDPLPDEFVGYARLARVRDTVSGMAFNFGLKGARNYGGNGIAGVESIPEFPFGDFTAEYGGVRQPYLDFSAIVTASPRTAELTADERFTVLAYINPVERRATRIRIETIIRRPRTGGYSAVNVGNGKIDDMAVMLFRLAREAVKIEIEADRNGQPFRFVERTIKVGGFQAVTNQIAADYPDGGLDTARLRELCKGEPDLAG